VQGETTLSGAPAAGKAQNIKPKLKSKVRYLLSCPYAPVPPPLLPPSTAQRNELKGSQTSSCCSPLTARACTRAPGAVLGSSLSPS
jgi:hypothetical protein